MFDDIEYATHSRCNRCIFNKMEQTAKERGVTLIIADDDGWVSVRYSDKRKPSAWFLELTEGCVC